MTKVELTLPVPVVSIGVGGVGGASGVSAKGGKLQMQADILPDSATVKTVAWAIVNGGGATIDAATGLLTAKANGTVTVRATADDDASRTGSGGILSREAEDGAASVYGEMIITITGQQSGNGNDGNDGNDDNDGNDGNDDNDSNDDNDDNDDNDGNDDDDRDDDNDNNDRDNGSRGNDDDDDRDNGNRGNDNSNDDNGDGNGGNDDGNGGNDGGNGGNDGGNGGNDGGGSGNNGGVNGVGADAGRVLANGTTDGGVPAGDEANGGIIPDGDASDSAGTDDSDTSVPAPADPQPAPLEDSFSGLMTDIFDGQVPLANLFGNEIPLCVPVGERAWSLVNLVLCLLGLVCAGIAALLALRKKKGEQALVRISLREVGQGQANRYRLFCLVAAALMAVTSIVLFPLTETLSQTMALVDFWTVFNLAIFGAEIAAICLLFKKTPVTFGRKSAGKTGK